MGTKTTEEFLKSLPAYHEVFDIVDDPEYSETQLLEFAKQYADHQSTSQKETIERLRDVLCEIMDYRKGNGNYNFSNLTKDDRYLAAIEAWESIELKIEQLLNTTEPIDQ